MSQETKEKIEMKAVLNTSRWSVLITLIVVLFVTCNEQRKQCQELDRNGDGQTDCIYFFRNGTLTKAEADNNFDGRVDSWHAREATDSSWTKLDCDFNGIPDVTIYFKFEIPVVYLHHPNSDSVIPLKCFYNNGIITRQLVSSNLDGQFDKERLYDKYGRLISEECTDTNRVGDLKIK